MVGILRSIYSTLGWNYIGEFEKNQPTENTLRQRHLVMKQIRESGKIKLKKQLFDERLSDTEIDEYE